VLSVRREVKRTRVRQAPAASQPARKRVSDQKSNSPAGKSAKKAKKSVEPKAEDETVKPTRPIGAYIFFSNTIIPKLKEEQKVAHRDAMSKAGEMWNTMSEEEKKPYEKKHQDDIVR
jgi:hypothetical protein